MRRMSLQWRLTCIITLYIAVICGCLTMLVYKNGVYYMESLQETVDAQGDGNGNESDEIYISIPEDKWDEMIFRSRYTTIRRITKKAA
jgi:two-component system sensor histidine kinase ArlS